jgi:predicted alpha/beta-hydrolase family hydrolase
MFQLIDGHKNAKTCLILAHGSGLGMDAPFMSDISQELITQVDVSGGFSVARFNFPYMQIIKETGRKRPPNSAQILMQSWKDAILQTRARGAETLFIGGKSMGGRIASMLADEERARGHIKGLVCLGYPFHPPGKPETLRIEHLKTLKTPTLICQGERDVFGNKKDVAAYKLSKAIEYCWLKDGDHGFKPRKKAGSTESDNIARAASAVAEFIHRLQ